MGWNCELFSCIWVIPVLLQKHTAPHAGCPLLTVHRLEEEDGQELRHQQEVGAPYWALYSGCQKPFKRVLHYILYCWVMKSTELNRSGLTHALFFAEGRTSALSSMSCSGSAR